MTKPRRIKNFGKIGGRRSTHQEAPSSDTSGQPSTAASKTGRHSTHYWFVDAIDEHGTTHKEKVTVKGIHNLADGLRVVVEFDDCFEPIGEAAGLLSRVCGQSAIDTTAFPIGYEKWSDMPDAFFNKEWNSLFMTRFFFKGIHMDLAKRSVQRSIGKKWKDNRLAYWDAFYDPTLSKEEIIQNVPEGVSMDQWALFVTYRLKPETMALCERNRQIRGQQTLPHTCGAKSIARTRHELKIKTGKNLGRGPMWNVTHKKKDGSYVNDKAKEIGEKIDNHISQNLEATYDISPNDPVGVVFGPEHPGRCRQLGLGAVPTLIFKDTTTRISGMDFASSSSNSPSYEELQRTVKRQEVELKELATMKSQMKALAAYCTAQFGGQILDELVGLLASSSQQATDDGSESNVRRSSDGSNGN